MAQSLPDNGYQFWNATPVFTVAANQTTQQQIQFDGGSWFDAYRFQFFATGADQQNGLLIPQVTLNISDTGSNEVWMQQPVLLGAICGRGDLPHVFVRPRRIAPRQVVRIDVNNLSATDYTLQLVLSGLRIRGTPAPQ